MASSKNINLLSQKLRKQTHTQKLQKRIFVLSTFALLIYLLILFPLLAYRFFLNAESKSLQKQTLALEGSIETNIQLETKYVLIATKLKLLNNLFKDRIQSKQIIENIFNLLPPGVTVSNISLAGKEEKISLSLIANNVFSYSDLIQTLQKKLEDNQYHQIIINSTSREEEGSYLINVDLSKDEPSQNQQNNDHIEPINPNDIDS